MVCVCEGGGGIENYMVCVCVCVWGGGGGGGAWYPNSFYAVNEDIHPRKGTTMTSQCIGASVPSWGVLKIDYSGILLRIID